MKTSNQLHCPVAASSKKCPQVHFDRDLKGTRISLNTVKVKYIRKNRKRTGESFMKR
jgi:hypothetical protein